MKYIDKFGRGDILQVKVFISPDPILVARDFNKWSTENNSYTISIVNACISLNGMYVLTISYK